MFWYGFEPVVNYSVKPLTSVGGREIEGSYRFGKFSETKRRSFRVHVDG